MSQQANGVAKGAQDKVQGATSGILGSIEAWGNWIANWGKGMLDKIFPPEKRAAFLAKLQSFMLKNPKLSTFLGMNLAVTGVPLFLFVLFSLTVFIFALVVGLLLGLLGAVAFTLFAVGLALTIVLPTIFFTTMGATFLFLWGLGGYYVLKWANGEGDSSSRSDSETPSIGDRLNSLVGGRLSGFMSSAKHAEAKKDISGYGDEHTPAKTDEKEKPQQSEKSEAEAAPKPKANGTAKAKNSSDSPSPSPQKNVTDAASSGAKKASDATNAAGGGAKKVTDTAGGAKSAVGSTAGTVTGGLGGAAGTA